MKDNNEPTEETLQRLLAALERIAATSHANGCPMVWDNRPCNCHVAIAQQAVDGKDDTQ